MIGPAFLTHVDDPTDEAPVTQKMSFVHTDKIRENMVLAEDIRDPRGRLLLKKGQKITGSHIRVFKMWGVTEVNIEGEMTVGHVAEPDSTAEEIKAAEDRLRPLFKHVDLNHPAVSELFRLSVMSRGRNDLSDAEGRIPSSPVEEPGSRPVPDVKKKIMQNNIKLPEIPSVIFELNQIMNDPLASSHDIAQVVTKSPSLATILLKIVNSSFFGFPSKIETITRAVTLLGTREIGNLAMGVTMISIFKGGPKHGFRMLSFMKHSFACAIISRILAAQKMMAETEQMFVSGLLHDIGRLIIYRYFPVNAKFLHNRSLKSGSLLYQEEEGCLGCRHTDIAGYLLEKWRLPATLENNILYHHDPSNAPDPVRAAIVHVADVLVNALGMGSSGERYVPPLDPGAWDLLELSPSCFEIISRQAASQLSAFETFFAQQEASSR